MLVLGQTSHPGMWDLALLAVGGHQLLVWLSAAWVVSALALLSVLIVLQFMPAVYWFVRRENFVQPALL